MEKKQVKKKKKPQVKRKESVSSWTPRPELIEIANALVNPEDKRTKAQKIKDAGLTEPVFYRWMKDERFINYINVLIDRYTDSELADVWKALMMKARRGDIAAIKLVFDMKGMNPEYKHKRDIDKEKLDIERKKLQLIENKAGNNSEAIDLHNQRLNTLASLLNSPVPDRPISDFEEEDDG